MKQWYALYVLLCSYGAHPGPVGPRRAHVGPMNLAIGVVNRVQPISAIGTPWVISSFNFGLQYAAL